MATNKVQFQQGFSMLEFFDLYATQEQCEDVVRQWRWPRGFVCPACGGSTCSEFRRPPRLYFQCCACRYQCSLIAGTIFESSKLPLRTWLLAMHLITQAKNNVSALELKRQLGISWPSAWMMKHKIMQVMLEREQDRRLTGRVEIDDAYLGGECHGGKTGRGSPNKVPFVAAVQTTESGAPVLVCFSRRPFTKESIQAFAATSLAAPATLVSDGLGCFTAVRGTGILHEPHITGGGAASVAHPDFLAVNMILGNLKTAFAGTYHSIGFAKYSPRYLAQVQYLFNRRFDLRTILQRLIRAACRTKPHPLHALQGVAELS
jgi:ISXO2-like transposase domain/Transposase zinc-ribbon domain